MHQRKALAVILLLLAVAAAGVPCARYFAHQRALGRLRGCARNLETIGFACEMYSTVSPGRFPVSLASLTPLYLKTIPTCPAAGTDTYSSSFSSRSNPDVFTICCLGRHHVDVGVGPEPLRYSSHGTFDIGNALVEARARVRRQCEGQSQSTVREYIRRSGCTVTDDVDLWLRAEGPSNLPEARRIVYSFSFSGSTGHCNDITIGYRMDARQ